MVRVAGLMGQAASGLAVRSADGLHAAVGARRRSANGCCELTAAPGKALDARAPAGARGRGDRDRGDRRLLDATRLAELDERFEREIFPVLTPLAVGPGQPFPYISGLSLSLGVFARDPETGEERFARVKVPEGLPRFFAVGKRGRLLSRSRRVIAHFLDRLFPGMEILERVGLPRHPRRGLRGLGRGRRPARGGRARAAAAALRRRRPGRGLELDVARRCSTRLGDGPRRRARPGLPDPRPARPRGPDAARVASTGRS